MEISEILEIIGLVAFAVAGVFVGIEYELDIFGIIVVSLCSALAGGVMRDVIVGRIPPMCFVYPKYIITVLITVIVSLIILKIWDKKISVKGVHAMRRVVDFCDALGLGVFTISGCQTAIMQGYEHNFILMVFVGTITAIGGGVIRDLLAGRKPIVMRKEVYALVAVTGSILYYFIYDKISGNIPIYIAAGFITIVRVIASWSRMNLAFSIKNEEMKKDE